jgi:hypothetical protein
MILQIFSVFDVKAGAYAPPFFMPTKGMAIRAFEEHCRDEKSAPFKHPEDYFLFHLGEFDDATGAITCPGDHQRLALASEFVQLRLAPTWDEVKPRAV